MWGLYKGPVGTGSVRSVFGENSVAFPEVKVQVPDLVRVVGIVASFVPRGSVLRESSLYRAPDGKWAHETCGGCPKQQ